ncbi:hypothetical protein GGI12_001464 [Dipsacomyces acuminosporus]|nr:hypothetical protein GGI12_001464 [Dipsacomyces acuminosporus]
MADAEHPTSNSVDSGFKSEHPRFRPFADPSAPGWAALAVSLFTFSFYSGAIGVPFDDPNVSTLAATSLIIGGLVVFVSGMWAFATNDTISATIFTLYGSMFGSIGYLYTVGFNIYNTLNQDKTVSHAAGTFWLAWMLITFVLFIGTIRYSAGTTAFMGLLFVSFIILTGGTWAGRRNVIKAGGWFSFFASLVAIYNAFDVIYKTGYSPLGALAVSEKFQRKGNRRQADTAAANV